ncbi:MAG: hypothetical protein IJP89_04130 [Synergistaceae bacterium]|nr:hypothetical protein [Synergistaceae bacterium]
MVKKLLCCAVLVMVLASGAWGEPYLWSGHYSMAGLSGGRSDYSQARFHRVFLEVDDDNHTATQAHVNATGTMTLSGGGYSYIDSDKACKPISGTSKTFELKAGMKTGENLVYYPSDDGYSLCRAQITASTA